MGLQMTPVTEEIPSGNPVAAKRVDGFFTSFDVNSHELETYSQKRAAYIPECGIYKIRLYFQEVNAILKGNNYPIVQLCANIGISSQHQGMLNLAVVNE